eukprot:gene7164-7971_t
MPCSQTTLVHMIAGGVGGTSGAIVTCPLDVLKTRQQSSIANYSLRTITAGANAIQSSNFQVSYSHAGLHLQSTATKVQPGILQCLRQIVQEEGVRALFKGLAPNLVGVTPSRAIYFSVYAKTKKALKSCGLLHKDSKLVPLFAGAAAGFSSNTVTCPVWVLKTRLQLDKRKGGSSLRDTIARLYRTEGLKGFYRGLLISYVGIAETSIHFVLYEHLKMKLRPCDDQDDETGKCLGDFAQFIVAASASKIVSCTAMYPHEVVRTRLRQPAVNGIKKYHSIVQTLRLVAAEEGIRGLYGGLGTQIARQIPNSATMFVMYEFVVSFLCNS